MHKLCTSPMYTGMLRSLCYITLYSNSAVCTLYSSSVRIPTKELCAVCSMSFVLTSSILYKKAVPLDTIFWPQRSKVWRSYITI